MGGCGVAEGWGSDGEQGGDKGQLVVTCYVSPLIISVSLNGVTGPRASVGTLLVVPNSLVARCALTSTRMKPAGT